MAAAQLIGLTTHPGSALELPHIPELSRVPQRLQAEDEGELRWFLDDPRIAGIMASGGMGAQLERAEAYGFGALPCRACGGQWRMRRRRRDGVEVVVGWRDGTGRRPKKRFGKQETYAVALARYRVEQRIEHQVVVVSPHPDPATMQAIRDSFEEQGRVAMTEAEVRDCWATLPEEETVECGACDGIGVVPRRLPRHVEVEAWPTGSSVDKGKSPKTVQEMIERADLHLFDGFADASIEALHRYQAVAIVLRDVATLSAVGRAVLERYYGPARWQQDRNDYSWRPLPKAHEALWELTTVGPEANSATDRAERTRQTDMLYSHAGACWNLCAYGVGWTVPEDAEGDEEDAAE